jgi:drug/metabolite transporter (DMT)-like permease
MTAGHRMTGRSWGLLLLLSFLWGVSFPLNAIALEEIDSVTIVLLRVALGACALACIAAVMNVRGVFAARLWPSYCLMAVLNIVLPFLLIVWGQTQITGGLASILNATTPLFVVVVAHALLPDEKMTPARGLGVALGFVGVVVVVGPAALGRAEASLWAHLAGVAAALSYALAGVYGRRFARLGVDPMAAAAATTLAGTLMLIPLALAFGRPAAVLEASFPTIGAIVGLGLLATAGGYVIYYRLLAVAGATNLMLVTFLMPPTAILIGWLALAEQLRPAHFAGMMLIACGLALIDGRVLKLLRWPARGRA